LRCCSFWVAEPYGVAFSVLGSNSRTDSTMGPNNSADRNHGGQ